MTRETFKNIELDAKYQKAVTFIHSLAIDLRYINVNDFSSSYPAVYVHNKYISFKVKKYHRWNSFNLKNAMKFHLTKNPRTKETVYGY